MHIRQISLKKATCDGTCLEQLLCTIVNDIYAYVKGLVEGD